jgi:UDP-N-acetylglucosamine 1-carboxyvinyltransferase
MATEETLIIHGGARLQGDIAVSGGKNAAVAIMPAALLADSPCIIENIPSIKDVSAMADMLKWLGAKVELNGQSLYIDPRGVNRCDPPYDLTCRMRASYYLIPVLLGRFGYAHMPLPGGCDIGARLIDQTIKGWTTLGAEVKLKHGELHVTVDKLRGTDVYLDLPSVGATVNTMLAAVLAEGNTTIFNPAKEPHIVDLANFLGSIGAWVKGAGTDIIRIRGRRPLKGSSYAIIPDQVETGTLMIAAAATGGDVTISGVIPYHMEALSAKLLEMGVYVHDEDDRIYVHSNGLHRGINIKTQVYPGYPTDLQQPMTAMLTMANGTSVVTETIFESRFRYVDELKRMGANIRVIDRVAIVDGVARLSGARVNATDLRASAALVVAGLIADGVTEIFNVEHIKRGYEDIDVKLRSLGAKIDFVTQI